jgi:3,4-dihydroxy 2-butanone 4-phosphate synthase / GTP cyclohydrolase II
LNFPLIEPGIQLKIINAPFNTEFGDFRLVAFYAEHLKETIVALVHGTSGNDATALVRIHSQCLTSEALHSLRCDCGEQLKRALELIAEAEYGILIYQLQEGRGIGLMNKLRAYELQDQGLDTVDANLRLGFHADLRTYDLCAAMLKHLGAERIRLLSNNPAKICGLEEHNIRVVEHVPIHVEASPWSEKYIRTKRERLGHLTG